MEAMVSRIILAAIAISTVAAAQNPVGQLFSTDAKVKGAVELAAGGARVMSGSFVSAGESTAVLRLDRGGEIRVCARTTLSVATSQSGRDLMLGLSAGCIEAHYTVSATADAIVTPDFRILLAGPGRFDFAVEAAKNGDTCIRALPGNSSSLIVTEQMGDATYQVKPAERLVFHNGKVQDLDHENAKCGCVSEPAVMRAEAESQPSNSGLGGPPVPSNIGQGGASESHPSNTSQGGAPTERASEAPKPTPAAHVEVDAPFVFHADDPTPAPMDDAISLHVSYKPLALIVLPPPVVPDTGNHNVPTEAVTKPQRKPKQGSFLGKVKSFFASIFR